MPTPLLPDSHGPSDNPPSRSELLDEILAQYIRDSESGENPSRDELLARHPDLAAELQEFFTDRDRMQRLAAPLYEPTLVSPAIAAAERIRYFGDYEVLEEIARGGMGVVFRARQVTLNRIVAVKMILSGHLASPADVERFHTEAEAAAKLDHPGIVPIYEVGQHEGQHYFSMGFVDGASLSARVAQGPLPVRESAEIVRAVSEAVQYAHDNGVIHRDLKPGNILIDRQGKPRVTDFGLAKLTESVSDLTGTGQILGTPGYMPPEQASPQANSVGRLADLYSLGAILYCLLTGRPPFQAASPLETLLQVQQQEPVPPRQLNPAIPLDLDTIVLKCLEKSPGRRYSTARELVDELQRFLEGHPIVARPVGAIERTWRWCRRNPVVGSLSAALMIVVLAGIGGIASEWLRAERHSQRAKIKEDEAEQALIIVQREKTRADDALEELQRENERTKDEQQIAETQKNLAIERLQLAQLGTYDLQLVRVRDAWRHSPQYAAELLNDTEKCPPALRDFAWGHYHRLVNPVPALFAPVDGKSGSVAFAPDGLTFAATGHSSPIRICDVMTSRERQVLSAPAGQRHGFGSLAYSANGKMLAAGGEDKIVRIWDPDSGQELMALAGHTNSISSIAFSPDGASLVSADRDQRIFVWDLEMKQSRATLEAGGAKEALVCVAFSPDGRTWAASSSPGELINGVSNRSEVSIRLWDAKTHQQRSILTGHGGAILSLAYSPDGKLLAGINQQTVMLWETATGRESTRIPNQLNSWGDACVSFSPDGKTLAVTRNDGIGFLDVSSRQMQNRPIGYSRNPQSFAFSPNGRILACCSPGSTSLWNVTSGQPLDRLPDSLAPKGTNADSIAFSPTSQTMASASSEGTITIWDFATLRPRSVLTQVPGVIRSLTFSPDGRRLAWIIRKTIVIWDVLRNETAAVIDVPGGPVYGICFSPDGKKFATAGWNGIVGIWDVTTGRQQTTLEGHVGHINCVAFAPDGLSLASAGKDQKIRIWNAVTGREQAVLSGHAGPVNSLAFSHESKTLASASSDGTIRLWGMAGLREQARLRQYSGAAGLRTASHVWSIEFTPDDKTLISAGSPATIKLWDAVTGVERASIDFESTSATHFLPRISSDGRVIAVATGSEIRLLWDRLGLVEPAHPDADPTEDDPVKWYAINHVEPSAPPPDWLSEDSPQWGGSPSRNNVRDHTEIPVNWDVTTGENIKWMAKLGSMTHGNTVIAGGKVFIGTNNAAGYLRRYPNRVDLGCLLCFSEATGEFLWQHSSEKLPTGRVHDWEYVGLCSTPLVEGQRLWVVTNRCEVVCLDTEGFLDNENDGPYWDEPNENRNESDVIWKLDMIARFGVSPHNMSLCSATAAGDVLFINTSNGVDESHKQVSNSNSPSFIALDKNTGKVLWTDNSPGSNILHGQWSSPSYAVLGGRAQVLFAGGDGWLYSFDPAGDGSGNSKLLWKFDCNPKESQYRLDRATRNPILGFPVIADGLIYIAVGEDPEHGEGLGHLWCIDPTRRLDGSDVSPQLVFNTRDPVQVIPHKRVQASVPAQGDFMRDNPASAAVWHYEGSNTKAFESTMHRAIGSPTIKGGLLYICDTSGLFHCVDANTGTPYWTHDLIAPCWSTPMIIGDRVYIPNQDGVILIFQHGRERRILAEVPMNEAITMATPVVAKNVLYIATMNKLYAIAEGAFSKVENPPLRLGDQPQQLAAVAPAAPNGNAAAESDEKRLVPAFRSLPGHTKPVWGVAYSADGRWLASGSDDNSVRLWDPDSGEFKTSLTGHTAQVRALAFSPDSSTLASGSFDKTIRFWDPSAGTLRGTAEDTELVYFPAFTGDGRFLVTSSSTPSPRVWNVAERTLLRNLDGHSRTAWAAALSQTTNRIATGGHDVAIKIWDVGDGRLVRTIYAHSAGLNSLAFSPDGKLLASAGGDKSIRLWNPADGSLHLSIPPQAETVYEVAFARDGKSLAAACGDGVVRLYDAESGALRHSLRGGGLCVAFSPSGKFIASGGNDNHVNVWHVPDSAGSPK